MAKGDDLLECGPYRAAIIQAEKTGESWIFFYHTLQAAEVQDWIVYLAAVYGKRFTWRDAARGVDLVVGVDDEQRRDAA